MIKLGFDVVGNQCINLTSLTLSECPVINYSMNNVIQKIGHQLIFIDLGALTQLTDAMIIGLFNKY